MRFVRRVAFTFALLAATSAPPAAEARDWAFLGAGAHAIADPTGQAGDVPFVGPTILAGLFDGSSDEWRLSSGLVVQLSAAFGPEGAWVGDAWIGYNASLGLTDSVADPFVEFGADLAYVEPAEEERGVVVGVRADLGLHGILFDWLFWRACVGVVGPGLGGLRTELSVGHGFD